MRLTGIALIALYLERFALNRAAYSAPLLELFAEGFKGVGVLRNPYDDRHGLATSSFCLSPNADDAVARSAGPSIAADAFDQLTLALGA